MAQLNPWSVLYETNEMKGGRRLTRGRAESSHHLPSGFPKLNLVSIWFTAIIKLNYSGSGRVYKTLTCP